MSDLRGDENPVTPEPLAQTPVTVVGYPDLPPVSTSPSVPGLAGVKMAVSSVRALAVVTLVLVLLLTVGLVVGIVALRGQVSDLSRQVADLSAQQAVLAERSATAGGGTGSAQATQLPAAPELPADFPAPQGVDTAGAVLMGDLDAANVVEVYVDYQCPYCQRWEQQIGEVLAQRAQAPESDLLIKQYNLAFLGETSPTLDPPGSSARAASAALCVLEGEGPDAFAQFNAEVFRIADPERSTVQFATSDMAQLASQIGSSPSTLACIEQLRHVPFVALVTQAGFGRGVQGTPTVILNGRVLEDSFSDSELIGLLG